MQMTLTLWQVYRYYFFIYNRNCYFGPKHFVLNPIKKSADLLSALLIYLGLAHCQSILDYGRSLPFYKIQSVKISGKSPTQT